MPKRGTDSDKYGAKGFIADRQGRRDHAVGAKERESLFNCWLDEGKSVRRVAAIFKRNRKTVDRFRIDDKWDERALTVAEKVAEKANEKIADKLVNVMEAATFIFQQEFKAYQDRKVRDGKVSEIARMLTLIATIQGDMPLPPASPSGIDVNLQLYLNQSPRTPEEKQETRQTLAEILSDSDFGG